MSCTPTKGEGGGEGGGEGAIKKMQNMILVILFLGKRENQKRMIIKMRYDNT